MRPTLRFTSIAAAIIYGISAVVWIYGFLQAPSRFRLDEFWLLLALFLVPGALVLASLRVLAHRYWWRRILGVVLLAPSVTIWLGVLLVASAGFRLH